MCDKICLRKRVLTNDSTAKLLLDTVEIICRIIKGVGIYIYIYIWIITSLLHRSLTSFPRHLKLVNEGSARNWKKN
jgi:hypothetical protein